MRRAVQVFEGDGVAPARHRAPRGWIVYHRLRAEYFVKRRPPSKGDIHWSKDVGDAQVFRTKRDAVKLMFRIWPVRREENFHGPTCLVYINLATRPTGY